MKKRTKFLAVVLCAVMTAGCGSTALESAAERTSKAESIVDTATPSPTPRTTAAPKATATPSPTPKPTATATPSPSPTPLPTATPSPTPLPTATPVPTEAPADDSSQVTPELKEFLDSYEALVDQYVVFMAKYKENPTDIELLMEYSTYMTKLADFAQKADDYETEESEMSAADYNYFITVYARIAQKLANASASLLS